MKKLVIAFSLSAIATSGLSADWRVSSEQTVGGFVNPESVGCDVAGKMLYVGNFGSPKLDPTLKDGMGYISKVGVDGKVVEKNFLPAPGGEKLNKPKGIWVQNGKLWVTDITVVWEFDLKTRKGRKVELPGATFANDPAVMDGALYVSDNRSDQLFKVEPADFLGAKKAPKVTTVFSGAKVNPNGVYPAGDGVLLMGGFVSPDDPKPVFQLGVSGQVRPLTAPIGRIDGLYAMKDGSILATDWNTGSLFHWSEEGGVKPLAKGFKGPADFCVMPGAGGLTAIVPDLVQSQVRFIQLRK